MLRKVSITGLIVFVSQVRATRAAPSAVLAVPCFARMVVPSTNGNAVREMTASPPPPPRLLPQGSMLQIVVALGFSIAFAITAAWCLPAPSRGEAIPPQA